MKYQDPEVAEQICKAKLQDAELSQTHVKDHPDAPGVEARSGDTYNMCKTSLTYFEQLFVSLSWWMDFDFMQTLLDTRNVIMSLYWPSVCAWGLTP